MNKKSFLTISLAAAVAVMAACSDEGEGNVNELNEGNNGNNEEVETQEEESAEDNEASLEDALGEEGMAEQPEMPEPDLDDIPDVVADVNGEEISNEEFEATYTAQFQQVAMQSQMSGEEVNQDQLKEQVADSLVFTELLVQEAENSDIEASQEDVDQALEEIIAQSGLQSEEEFMNAMQEQGVEEDEVMSQVETEVIIDKVIAAEAGEIEATDEELQEMYDMVVAQQEQMGEASEEEVEIPSFEEVEPELEQQVVGQKEAEATQTYVESLREEADVTIHL
ncbi:SurA N-terminal domain-containing protein [Salipaludibacillus sp. HK11]|uniref:SurA N-terminal domain-containing protein n=1 Tax=Salipaludibacillus sp. HK11 TaxID=3394320 RepID=UPI0039FC2990